MPASARVAALLYHNVAEVGAEECRGITVAPNAFARHMSALKAMGFSTVSSADWVRYVRMGGELPRRAVMITFDDGFASLAEHAFPRLEQHGFTATVFVPTALVGATIPCKPTDGAATLPLLSEEQIKEWHAKGIEFGAHSHHHVDLTTLSAQESASEMETSKSELSRILGEDVETMAFPFGKTNTVVTASAASLFQAAFTIEEGVNDSSTSLHGLKRTMVQHGDTIADFCLRAGYGMSPLERVRTAVRRTFSGN